MQVDVAENGLDLRLENPKHLVHQKLQTCRVLDQIVGTIGDLVTKLQSVSNHVHILNQNLVRKTEMPATKGDEFVWPFSKSSL